MAGLVIIFGLRIGLGFGSSILNMGQEFKGQNKNGTSGILQCQQLKN